MRHEQGPLKLTSLNHISLVCRSLEKTLYFYRNVLGFFPVRRPDFDFDGAWLFNYGMGVHLLESDDPGSMPEAGPINKKANHVSFQCSSMASVEKRLGELEIVYEKSRVEESGVVVDQLFFHDPDGVMIEICNCDNLPVVPLAGDGAGRSQVWSGVGCNISRRKRSLGRLPSVEEFLPGRV